MNTDISNNRLLEIRKILKERRKQKSFKTVEMPEKQPEEKTATIVPSFTQQK